MLARLTSNEIWAKALRIVLMFALVFWVSFRVECLAFALSTDTLYPSNYQTSRSKVVMAPLGVFANKDRSSVVILLKVGDMSRVSDDAKDYMVFLGAINENGEYEEMLSKPAVGFYMYDVDGYLAVTLQNGEPFPKQIMYGLFRNGRDFSGSDVTSGKLTDVYDVWTINFNTGADGVIPTSAFGEDGSFSPDDFYFEVLVSRSEMAQRKTLVADVESLEAKLELINEYTRRVQEDGASVEGMTPAWVAGDSVVTNDDGSKSFVTKTVCPGGYDFDWYHGNVTDGYIKDVLKVSSDSEAKAALSANASIAVPFEYDKNASVWKTAEGENVKDVAQYSNDARTKKMLSDIELLEKTWSDYAELKSRYQTTDLSKLLELELSTRSVQGAWTSNVDQSCVSYRD